jgi:ABC-2 type transport system ATP-binding protein
VRRLVVLGLVLLVAAGSAGAAGATPVDLRAPKITDQFVDVGGGVRLDTTLIVPAGADPTHPVPAVVLAHGWNLVKGVEMDEGRQLAAHGYLVLLYSARGHGSSTGVSTFDRPDAEGADVRKLVDWLASRPEVLKDGPGDPRVGISGQSYGGAIALIAAGLDTRIDAVFAEITWSDLDHAFAPNDDEVARAQGVGGPLKQQYLDFLFPTCKLTPDMCAALSSAHAAGHATSEFQKAFGPSSPVTLADRIRAPVLLVQGERDTLFGVDEAVTTFNRIKAEGRSEVAMIWTSGGHGYPDPPAERDVKTPDPKDVVASRLYVWFDRYLKVIRSVAPGVEFTWWDRSSGRWRTSPSYPILGEQTIALRPTGPMTMTSPAGGQPASYRESPGAMADPANAAKPPTDPPGQAVVLESAPLGTSADVVGPPRLKVTLSSATGEIVVFATLFDVAPDGTARMIPRDVAAVRITGAPGQASERTIDLRGVTEPVAAGHRLRVVLASTDAGYGARAAADTYTVSGPLELTLPVLPHETHAGGPLAVAGGVVLGLLLLAFALFRTRRTRGTRRPGEVPSA